MSNSVGGTARALEWGQGCLWLGGPCASVRGRGAILVAAVITGVPGTLQTSWHVLVTWSCHHKLPWRHCGDGAVGETLAVQVQEAVFRPSDPHF